MCQPMQEMNKIIKCLERILFDMPDMPFEFHRMGFQDRQYAVTCYQSAPPRIIKTWGTLQIPGILIRAVPKQELIGEGVKDKYLRGSVPFSSSITADESQTLPGAHLEQRDISRGWRSRTRGFMAIGNHMT
jgi:hypothetical protein